MDIPENWTFKNKEVAEAFDAHVREQLPWYDLATGIVSHIARHYIPENGHVVDVGASTGNIGRAIAATLTSRKAELTAIDNSPDMAKTYAGPGTAIIADAVEFDFDRLRPDLITAFLTLMFVPVHQRRRLIERMKASLRPGGALLVFDKIAPRAGYIGAVVYRLTLAAKYEAGASAEQIIQKELSLAGIQRPMEEAELHDFQPVFRFGDFGGYLFERGAS